MNLTYDEFYEKYYELIKSVVYKYNFRSSKEDVVQDIMIMIWQDFEKIKNTDIQNENGYVCGIARNCCKTYVRREHEKGLYICNSEDTIYRFSNNSMIYNVETDTRNGETIVLDDYIKNYRKERAEYSMEYRKKNKEKVAAYNKKYKQEHKDEINSQRRIYREKNKDKIKAYQRAYHQKKKEEKLNGKTS